MKKEKVEAFYLPGSGGDLPCLSYFNYIVVESIQTPLLFAENCLNYIAGTFRVSWNRFQLHGGGFPIVHYVHIQYLQHIVNSAQYDPDRAVSVFTFQTLAKKQMTVGLKFKCLDPI